MPKTLFERMSEAQRQRRPILDRMAAAKAHLIAQWQGRRTAKAFYLGPEDWDEFMATEPQPIATIWNRVPATEVGFGGVPVRLSKAKGGASRLYDHTSTGRLLPE
jgi:hypothetical protein